MTCFSFSQLSEESVTHFGGAFVSVLSIAVVAILLDVIIGEVKADTRYLNSFPEIHIFSLIIYFLHYDVPVRVKEVSVFQAPFGTSGDDHGYPHVGEVLVKQGAGYVPVLHSKRVEYSDFDAVRVALTLLS